VAPPPWSPRQKILSTGCFLSLPQVFGLASELPLLIHGKPPHQSRRFPLDRPQFTPPQNENTQNDALYSFFLTARINSDRSPSSCACFLIFVDLIFECQSFVPITPDYNHGAGDGTPLFFGYFPEPRTRHLQLAVPNPILFLLVFVLSLL